MVFKFSYGFWDSLLLTNSDLTIPTAAETLINIEYQLRIPYCRMSWNLASLFVHSTNRRFTYIKYNKANLRDLMAATGLVISNWIQIVNSSACATVTFDGWPCKTIGHLFHATSSFVHHFVPIGEFKLELQSGNAQFWSKSTICELCDLEIWRMTLKNNRAHLLCYFKLCASFRTHWWIQTWVSVWKRPIWVKFDNL